MTHSKTFRLNPILIGLLSTVATAPAFADTTEAQRLPTIQVVSTATASLDQTSGSVSVLDQDSLAKSHPMTTNEALRKIAGVNVRDEEGFGLRPNIAIRGLNPTRSTKVTLLEDGLPLSYAPYGDNASYYHPLIERYQRIEMLTGADILRFGPQTISGVINYVTPEPTQKLKGYVQGTVGNREFVNAKLNVSGKGALLDYSHKEGQGSRDNMQHTLDDLNFKYTMQLSERQDLIFKANYYKEDSQVTYTGLTEQELKKLGRDYNPFKNDQFDIERTGLSATHRLSLDGGEVLTSVYYNQFDRDWWRQSSNSTDAQCGAAFVQNRLNGIAVDPDACNSAQGRLRSYDTWGIEPRLTLATATGELQAGVKAHFEEQNRLQVNATSPEGRTGTKSENNLRETDAYSAFVSHRFNVGDFGITPIVRYESIDTLRSNRLTNQSGSTRIEQFSSGLGMTWSPSNTLTVFSSLHEGFAPPRAEDLVNNTGTVVEVDAEESLNFELGLRAQPMKGVSLQTAYFRNDFDNLIAAGSIAGGTTPLSQGQALFDGLEFTGSLDLENGLFSRVAYTWLNKAEQSTAFTNVATNAAVGVAGKRQPYAPEHTLTTAVGYEMGALRAEVEAQYVGSQFSDFANTEAAAANGQTGRIASYTVWNSSVNYQVSPTVSAFITGKNLTDKTYIVDRTRGIQLGMPRLIQVGAKYSF